MAPARVLAARAETVARVSRLLWRTLGHDYAPGATSDRTDGGRRSHGADDATGASITAPIGTPGGAVGGAHAGAVVTADAPAVAHRRRRRVGLPDVRPRP